jgi:predicted AAA+ superfamily ATPase
LAKKAKGPPGPIVLDEVQKVPDLLDEVHWLIENTGLQSVLCGSSARKLRRGHGNLLGGRALRYELSPLTYSEVPDFSLDSALNDGLMPPYYGSRLAQHRLESYVGDYLKEEIAAEALTRNVPSFSRFLEMAALGNGEIVNLANIGREAGVSQRQSSHITRFWKAP